MRRLLIISMAGLAMTATAFAGPKDTEQLYTIPERQERVHPRMTELMGWGLNQPNQLTKLESLAEISRFGLNQLASQVADALADDSPLVRAAAIQTLDELDAGEHAEALLPFIAPRESWSAHDTEAALAADVPLARWKTAAAVPAWKKRLTGAATPVALRVAAAQALGQVQQELELLTQTALDPAEPLSLRMAAAEAAAHFTGPKQNPLKTAEQLLDREPLLVIRLLSKTEDRNAVPLLQKLATSSEPAIQGAAMQRLLAIDPSLLWPAFEETITSADPAVRLTTVQSLPTRVDPTSVTALLATLDDPHPDVRTEARSVLRTLAGHSSLTEAVRDGARKLLAQAVAEVAEAPAPHWRASEQATLLLGELDDKPSAPTMVKLFTHSRLEVRVASVVSLRDLAVASTRAPMAELLDTLIGRLETYAKQAAELPPDEASAAYLKRLPDSELLDEVAQTLGAWRVTESDASLRKLIPKNFPATPAARASAIWALGLLHENVTDEALAKNLIARVFDLNPLNPEADEVRLASVIAIGRMKAASQVDSLLNRYRQDSVELQCAARWAVMNITGEPLDPVTLESGLRVDAFLAPIDDD